MGTLIPLFSVVPDTKLAWCPPKTSQNVLKFSRRFTSLPYTQHKIPTLKMPFFFSPTPLFVSPTPNFSQVSVCSLSSILFSLLHSLIFPISSQSKPKKCNSSWIFIKQPLTRPYAWFFITKERWIAQPCKEISLLEPLSWATRMTWKKSWNFEFFFSFQYQFLVVKQS